MRGNGIHGRSIARLYGVLALFQHVKSEEPMQAVIASYLSRDELDNPKIPDVDISGIDGRFFKKLLCIVDNNYDAVNDVVVRNLSSDWSIDRVDPVALCIIQLGASEILYFPNIPGRVVLNEYATIASCFFRDAGVSFVSGILNSIARLNRSCTEFDDERNRDEGSNP